MRDLTSPQHIFLQEVEKLCSSLANEFLRTAVFDNPTLRARFLNEVIIKTNNQQLLQFLSIIHWYLDPERFSLVHLALEEKYKEKLSQVSVKSDSKKYQKDDSSFDVTTFGLLLQSKALMLNFLLETAKWNQNEFFGILNSQWLKANLRCKVKYHFEKTSRPVRPVRRRGYKDKGSLKFSHDKRDIGPQTLLHEKLQLEIKTAKDTLAFLQGWLE